MTFKAEWSTQGNLRPLDHFGVAGIFQIELLSSNNGTINTFGRGTRAMLAIAGEIRERRAPETSGD